MCGAGVVVTEAELVPGGGVGVVQFPRQLEIYDGPLEIFLLND